MCLLGVNFNNRHYKHHYRLPFISQTNEVPGNDSIFVFNEPSRRQTQQPPPLRRFRIIGNSHYTPLFEDLYYNNQNFLPEQQEEERHEEGGARETVQQNTECEYIDLIFLNYLIEKFGPIHKELIRWLEWKLLMQSLEFKESIARMFSTIRVGNLASGQREERQSVAISGARRMSGSAFMTINSVEQQQQQQQQGHQRQLRSTEANQRPFATSERADGHAPLLVIGPNEQRRRHVYANEDEPRDQRRQQRDQEATENHRRASGVNDLDLCLVNHEEERSSIGVMKRALEKSKQLNSIILACHIVLVISFLIDFATTGLHPTESRQHNGPRDRNRIDGNWWLPSMLLITVTTLDLVNQIHWHYHHHHKYYHCSRLNHQLTPHSEGKSQHFHSRWLRSTLEIVANPRHLFRVVEAFVLLHWGIGSGSFGSSIASLLIRLHHSVNRIVSHTCHLSRVTSSNYSSLGLGVQPNGERSVEGEEKEVTTNKKWQVLRWPFHRDGKCNEENTRQLQRVHLISQLVGVKLIILILLMHINSLANKPPGCQVSIAEYSLLFGCLFESFLAMHSYYDKYHTRYLAKSTEW